MTAPRITVGEADIEGALGEYFAPPTLPPTVANGYAPHAASHADAERRAVAYVAKLPPAISGQGGHDATFYAACACVRFGLDEAATYRVLTHYNARCVPPWSDAELRHKAQSAHAHAAHERGAMLSAGYVPARHGYAVARPGPDAEPDAPPLMPMRFADLRAAHPHLAQPVVDKIIREGETCNVISVSKIGKSWLMYGLALSIATGRRWLDLFPCAQGKVLLIDNELHPPTIAHRIPTVAEAMGTEAADYADALEVLPLRGRMMDLTALAGIVLSLERGAYRAVILDAWYRFIPQGLNENSNADVMSLYNRIDNYAESTGAAWFVVHHSSKGNQGEKSVTDVGAGAGAQSRAADTHLILREHEEPGHVVMEAAVRSFPPLAPVGLEWTFPLWRPALTIDPKALKGRRPANEERQVEKDLSGIERIRKALAKGGMTVRQVRRETGFSKARAERLLDQLSASGEVVTETIIARGNETSEYRLASS